MTSLDTSVDTPVGTVTQVVINVGSVANNAKGRPSLRWSTLMVIRGPWRFTVTGRLRVGDARALLARGRGRGAITQLTASVDACTHHPKLERGACTAAATLVLAKHRDLLPRLLAEVQRSLDAFTLATLAGRA